MEEVERSKAKGLGNSQPQPNDPMFDEKVKHFLRYVDQKKAEVEDIAFLELCEDVMAFLQYANGKEKAIAFAIVDKYGEDGVKGRHMTHYQYVDLAIKAKRAEEFSKSIYYYNQFFKESSVGKAWFMTYYGFAKTLAVAGKYDFALVAIKISIELALMTECADAEFISNNHYINILHLCNGGSNDHYLRAISGFYE